MAMIAKLNSSFPTPNYGTAESRLKAFVEASAPYADPILEAAVSNFVAGRVATHNSAFMPTPAQLGTECLRLANIKAESDARTKRFTYTALPEPERAPITEESKARVRKMIKDFAEGPGRHDPSAFRSDNVGRSIGEIEAATQAKFTPSMDPDETRKRLKI